MALMAQDDDLYFTPKKRVVVETSNDRYGMPKDTYYSGSDRSVDEYNRRVSHYDLIAKDSTLNDTIHFSAEKGVYPDSTLNEDFEITRKMSRFDDYRIADNEAFWAGYEAGRYDWGLIPGSIPGIIALGTILGTTAMLAGIHLGITTPAGIGAGVHTILIPVMLL